MANVTFSATQYTGTGVPTGVADSAFNGAKVTATSDASGLADFTGLADGYYLFHQVKTVNGLQQLATLSSKSIIMIVKPASSTSIQNWICQVRQV